MELRICGYTPEDKQLAEKIIMHIKREAAQKFPYLEKGIFYLKPEANESVKYLGANYTTLYYNPLGVIELYEKKPVKLVNTLVHVVLHCMLLHPSFDMENDTLFDAAADAVVNAMLERNENKSYWEFTTMLRNCKADTAAQLYNAAAGNQMIEKRLKSLVERHKQDDHFVWRLQSQSGQQGVGNSQNGGISRDGNNSEMSGSGQLSEQMRAEMAAAALDWYDMLNMTKSLCNVMYGNTPGNIFAPVVPPDRFSRFSYDEYIRRFTAEEILKDDPETIDMMLYTTSMEMYEDTPIVEWNEISERCNPSDLIIAMDMSGSCGGDTASNFLRQIYSLFEAMNIGSNVNIHVVFFDTRILKTCVIQNRNEADNFINSYEAFGFGGTDFNCVFDYADEFQGKSGGRRLKGLFFFSDACGEFPMEKKNYPTTFFVPEEENSFECDYDFVPDWVELVHYKD